MNNTNIYYGTNMFLIYNKLPIPVQMIFIEYMKHPISQLLKNNTNKTLKNLDPVFDINDIKIIYRIKILEKYNIELLKILT